MFISVYILCKRITREAQKQRSENLLGHAPSGGQIVKSQEISVFIMLSC